MILRHYFCSVCVMEGIDFITIAAWLGHKDGGILIDKVYGHLLDQHRSKAAKQVRFGHGFSRGSERTQGKATSLLTDRRFDQLARFVYRRIDPLWLTRVQVACTRMITKQKEIQTHF